MSHYISAYSAAGGDIDELNVAGDLSSFYKFFEEDNVSDTNGDGKFQTTVAQIQEYLKTENKNPKPNSGESLLREFLAEVINVSPTTEIIFECN